MINTFDSAIIHFMNQFAFRSEIFDRAVLAVSQFSILSGLPLITLLWWIWFRGGPTQQRDREIVIATLVSAFCVLVLGRFLAHWLPFRLRPIVNPELALRFPMSEEDLLIRTWSAFPSDHAMLWAAVTTGVMLAAFWLGLLALVYAVLIVSMARVYLGLHYPTDILVGAAMGIAFSLLLNQTYWRQRIAAPVLQFSQRHQGLFHVGMFLLSFQLATHFDELRALSASLLKRI